MPANARFQCDFGVGEAIGSFIIWLLLIVVTLGLASFVAPYYVLSAIINQTWVIDENGRKLAQLRVSFTLAEIVGHAVIWVLLAIVTLGLAIIVYYYMVVKKVPRFHDPVFDAVESGGYYLRTEDRDLLDGADEVVNVGR